MGTFSWVDAYDVNQIRYERTHDKSREQILKYDHSLCVHESNQSADSAYIFCHGKSINLQKKCFQIMNQFKVDV